MRCCRGQGNHQVKQADHRLLHRALPRSLSVQTQESMVRLSPDEIALLIEALDSHEYWQLSESHERNDGYSMIEDGENEEIDAVRLLIAKLERSRR